MFLGKFNFRSLSSRLALSYLTLIAIFLCCAFIYGVVEQNKSKVHQYENALIYIENDYLSFSRDLQELVSEGYKKEWFYENDGRRIKQILESHHANMDRRFKELDLLGLNLDLDLSSIIEEIIKKNKDIFKELQELKDLILLRGYKDYGSVGEMRNFAHQIEEKGFIGLAPILLLRRYEKDFLLRGDLEYQTKFNSLIRQITEDGKGVTPDQNKLLKAYQESFNNLVAIDQKLGINNSEGLYSNVLNKISDLRYSLAKIITMSRLRIEEKIYLTKNLLYLVLALGTMALIALSIIMSRLLSKDFQLLSQRMETFSSSGFMDVSDNKVLNANILEVEKINTQFTTLSNKFKEALVMLENAKTKAEQISNYKSMFLANMSHEIRTPLNGIIGMVNIMKQEQLNAGQKRYMDVIAFSADHLLSLVNMILDYSKIDAGKLELEKSNFDLSEDLSKVLSIFQANAHEKGINLLLENQLPQPCPVIGDSLRIHQILINLINNALKFTTEGEIKVKARELDESEDLVTVLIEVQDTGIGIDSDKIDSIVEAFEQSDKSTTREYGGTGLGLSISNQLLGLMGSELKIDSQLGQGSTFSFVLSLKKGEQIKKEEPAQEAPGHSNGFKVLVAEDNPVNQEVMMIMLDQYNLEVSMVDNGKEALERFDKEHFDLVLLDLQMPVMDGWVAAKEIKKTEKFVHQPVHVVAVTANAFNDDKENALNQGFDDFIGKPIKPDELSRVLKNSGLLLS